MTVVSPATFDPVVHSISVARAVTVADKPGIAAVAVTGTCGVTPSQLSKFTTILSAGGEKLTCGFGTNFAPFSYAPGATSVGLCGPTKTNWNTPSHNRVYKVRLGLV